MNVNSLSSLVSPYIESILGTTGSTGSGTTAGSTANSVDPSSLTLPQDGNPQLSPFASILSQLQQMQESNPTEYQQVTSQISTNLQSAAQTASADGDTSQASELNQLATDFQNASQNNTLPNIQDLAQAIGGGGHGYHHHMASSSSDSTSSSSSSTSGSSTSSSTATGSSSNSDLLSQLMSMFFGNNTSASQTNQQLDPMSIITSTLNSATQS